MKTSYTGYAAMRIKHPLYNVKTLCALARNGGRYNKSPLYHMDDCDVDDHREFTFTQDNLRVVIKIFYDDDTYYEDGDLCFIYRSNDVKDDSQVWYFSDEKRAEMRRWLDDSPIGIQFYDNPSEQYKHFRKLGCSKSVAESYLKEWRERQLETLIKVHTNKLYPVGYDYTIYCGDREVARDSCWGFWIEDIFDAWFGNEIMESVQYNLDRLTPQINALTKGLSESAVAYCMETICASLQI
jgi:hypothetical protein